MPRIKKLYLHIGPHKTGSTALQSLLAKNIRGLEASGVSFITAFSCGLTAHSLADALSTNQFLRVELALNEVNAMPTDLIISSENFCRLNEDQISFLSKSLSDFHVELIYYIRNPARRLQSAWQEWVKHGYRFTFPEYIAARVANFTNDPEINDSVRIKRWKKSYPEADLAIYSYDDIPDIPTHFFANHTRLELDCEGTPIRENIGTDIGTTEAQRASSSAHRILLQDQRANLEFEQEFNQISQRIIEWTKKGEFLGVLSASFDEGPFFIIEKNLKQEFPDLIDGNGHIFRERKVECRYVDSNIWIDDEALSHMMYSLKNRIFERYSRPPLDVRLNRV